jgi:hypothetical protein
VDCHACFAVGGGGYWEVVWCAGDLGGIYSTPERVYEGEGGEERGVGEVWLQRSVMTVHCVRSRKYYM